MQGLQLPEGAYVHQFSSLVVSGACCASLKLCALCCLGAFDKMDAAGGLGVFDEMHVSRGLGSFD